MSSSSPDTSQPEVLGTPHSGWAVLEPSPQSGQAISGHPPPFFFIPLTLSENMGCREPQVRKQEPKACVLTNSLCGLNGISSLSEPQFPHL